MEKQEPAIRLSDVDRRLTEIAAERRGLDEEENLLKQMRKLIERRFGSLDAVATPNGNTEAMKATDAMRKIIREHPHQLTRPEIVERVMPLINGRDTPKRRRSVYNSLYNLIQKEEFALDKHGRVGPPPP
jgi:hypothetical protein